MDNQFWLAIQPDTARHVKRSARRRRPVPRSDGGGRLQLEGGPSVLRQQAIDGCLPAELGGDQPATAAEAAAELLAPEGAAHSPLVLRPATRRAREPRHLRLSP